MSPLIRSRGLLALLAVVLLATGGCAPLAPKDPQTSQATRKPMALPATHHVTKQHRHAHKRHHAGRSPTGSAAVQLASLRVAGRAPMTGYDRDRFGQAWLDADRNGCDTRNDILRRDLSSRRIEAGTQGCVVLSGMLDDPYTGRRIDYVRGESDNVDIDHVVALGDAWSSGAWRFDIHTRAALANDPLNLLAVDSSENRSKGDSDAASWLPPNKAFRCAYVARQIAVKAKYHLAVTPAERDQMARQLGRCPGQPETPDATHAPTRVDQHLTDPGLPTPVKPQHASESGGSVYYENCDAAREAGVTPLHRGDPGYDAHLDRDGDGTACE